MLRKIQLFFIFLIILFSPNSFSAVTSYDYTFVANDIFSSDFHSRLNSNFSKSLTGGINAVTAANVTDDSLLEADMADEINPRVRTYEGAACEFVYTGLLPVTSGSLSTTISAGTAYPKGYRINKASSTNKTFTASKWTYVDLDINGDFQYTEVAIDASAPSVASNSIRLARVSSDSSTVNSVSDLRRTSCANGPFSVIGSSSDSNEPNLNDMFSRGSTGRLYSAAGRTPQGFINGFQISWDTHTAFKVKPGAAYINGEYRAVSTDISVPQTADAPSTGVSGIDTGAIAASTGYYVFLIADSDSTKTPSVTYSTSQTPSGVTNYRLIGRIVTDATSLFTSRDMVTVHSLNDREFPGAWVNFDGSAAGLTVNDSYNVSSLSDGGTGNWTITFDADFNTANQVVFAGGKRSGSNNLFGCATASQGVGSITVQCNNQSDTATDLNPAHFIVFGDMRR